MNTAAAKATTPRTAELKGLKQAPKVREMFLEDYDQVAALQVRNGLAIKPGEEWAALWRENPAYKQRLGQWPIGWVLETEGGEIVGSVGNIPLAYRFRGRELRAATACSWVVDQQYRPYSTAIFWRFMRQKDVDLFICTTVSRSAEPVANGFRFSQVPVGNWQQAAFWITNYRGFARSALSTKSISLAPVLSYPVSVLLFCRDKFTDSRLAVHKATLQIEPCTDFDGRFDEFWDELARQNNGVLLAVRTRETLAWHFRAQLLRQSAWILAVCKGSRLIGYAIFDRQDNLALGLKRVRLVDFQAIDDSERVRQSTLSWMLRRCREEGIHVLEVIGWVLDQSSLSPMAAPYRRTLSSWTYYYKATNAELSATLQDPMVWAPSSFDGDASI